VEKTLTRSFLICTLRQVYNQVGEDEIGRTCSTNGGEEERV
jgi:hypothetical protein